MHVRISTVPPCGIDPSKTMTARLSSIVLLLTILLGSIAGPHPCWANQAAPAKASSSVPSAMPGMSCHGHGDSTQAKAPASHPNREDGAQKRQQTMCEKACANRLAVLAVRLPEIAQQPSTWTARVAPVRLLPLLVEPIDHIPLA